MGSIVQINTSRGGIPKRSVLHAVVGRLGIEGDAVAHPKFHGGPKQALLLIGEEAIEEITAMGHPLFAGALGENLTTRGLDRKTMRLGQRYRVGTGILELTKVRVPCHTLDVYGPGIQARIYDKDVKAGDFRSPRWGLSGFYASVIQDGEIHPGDGIELVETV